MGGAGCCEDKPFGEPCSDCAFDLDAHGQFGRVAQSFVPHATPLTTHPDVGCILCGAECSTDPLTWALQWAVRMHDPGRATGFGDVARVLHSVATAPGVESSGFHPAPVDFVLTEYVLAAAHAAQGVERTESASPEAGIVEGQPTSTSSWWAPEWRRGHVTGGDVRLEPRHAGGPAVDVKTPERTGAELYGPLSYHMRLRYCGLDAGSWMYQEVDVFERGTEMEQRNGRRSRGEKTDQTTLIREIFRVDEDGCTIVTDSHHAGVSFTECPLCDYLVVRETRQYKNAHVVVPAGASLDDGQDLPDELEWVEDSQDYHLLRYRQTGHGCLLEAETDYTSPITVEGKQPDGKWEMRFDWAIPCGGDPVPPPPVWPSQPPCGDRSGVPTITTSADFRPSGYGRLRPGPAGWRRRKPEEGTGGKPHLPGGVDPVPESPASGDGAPSSEEPR